MITLIPFARRRNQDSTVDSICTKCYQTIASEEDEVKLVSAEQRHTCNPNGEFNLRHETCSASQ
jgi:hypothetical protein